MAGGSKACGGATAESRWVKGAPRSAWPRRSVGRHLPHGIGGGRGAAVSASAADPRRLLAVLVGDAPFTLYKPGCDGVSNAQWGKSY
ncbi:hypothetical protein GCM10009665_46550 [Kitasatospora nipponensis]|uniref:Uncharacterized protein n=1 Tax=Kitasatospora nipponensis TaxID=258049 RepID=A0ABN1WHG1_9ACTN